MRRPRPRCSPRRARSKVEEITGCGNLSDTANLEMNQYVNAALKAHAVFKKDIDYVVKDGQVIIVDEFTGRLMFGRRWSDGLHQAMEAKEGVEIQEENQTLATITYQNYFRLYKKLAGMTGTAKTEEDEFRKIYALGCRGNPHQPAGGPQGQPGYRLQERGIQVPGPDDGDPEMLRAGGPHPRRHQIDRGLRKGQREAHQRATAASGRDGPAAQCAG